MRLVSQLVSVDPNGSTEIDPPEGLVYGANVLQHSSEQVRVVWLVDDDDEVGEVPELVVVADASVSEAEIADMLGVFGAGEQLESDG
jgi:hypothetical protein